MAAFRTREAQLRLDAPDSAHRFQVSTRRLRSLLGPFEALLDAKTGAALDEELRDLALTVDEARDAQAAQRRLAGLLGDEPDAQAVSRVDLRLADLLDRTRRESWERAITRFDSPQYDSFTRTLDRFADLPPWTLAADTAADKVVVPALRREWMRLLSRGRDVQELEAGPARDRRLEGVRRAAKRAKDVAEAQEAISGRKVQRLRKAAGAVASALGDYHDAVLTGDLLEAAALDLEGADAVAKRLRRREAAAAGASYQTFVRRFREADRKSLRAWMS